MRKWFLSSISLLILLSASSNAADYSRHIYVINESGETLSKLNLSDYGITQNILTTGVFPNQIVAHDGLIYVVNSGSDDVMVIDPQNDQTVRTIALPVGSNPWHIGFAGGNKAYVTNWIGHDVSILDLETGTVTGSIPAGKAPQGILIHENAAYVANTGYDAGSWSYGPSSITVIDIVTDSVTDTIMVPANAQDLAMAPDGRLHVVCTGDYFSVNGQIAVIDLHTGPSRDRPAVVDTVHFAWIAPGTTTFTPADLVITPDGKAYCVAWGNGTNGFLCSYDANTLTPLRDADNPFPIGPNVSQICMDPTDNSLWIPTMTVWGGDGSIQKFDTVSDTVTYVSGVLGSGTKSACILEANTAVTREDAVPAGFGFKANYPNPFNPETEIAYSLDRDTEVTVTVYNTLGQLVETLVHCVKKQGIHTVKWDAADMPGGLYLCRLEAGRRADFLKMTLMR